ncbi:MAG: glycosyltransferase family 2 protein, partial [Solirubrobacteraceae bacterium]
MPTPLEPDLRISVITVIHNSGDVISEMLRSVDGAAEVVVVDNASTDGGSHLVQSARPDAVLVTRMNDGFGAGCNAGVRAASGGVLIFLNPDCRP